MLKKMLKTAKSGSLFNILVVNYMLLIILPVSLIGWISFKVSEELLTARISESNRQTINQIERNVRTLLDQATAVVSMNYLNHNIEPYLTRTYTNPYDEIIDRAVVEKSMLQMVLAFDWLQFESYIIGKNGLVYSPDDISESGDADMRRMFANGAEIRKGADQIWWSGIKDSKLKNKAHQKVFEAVKVLSNPYNRLEYGMFVLSIKEDSLFRIYRDSLGSDMTFFILDQDGRYVTHSRRDQVGKPAAPALAEQIGSARENSGITTIYGENALSSMKYLEGPGWTLVMTVSTHSLFRDVRGLSHSILWMGILLVGISIVAAVWISRRIAMPLIRLNQRLRAFRVTGDAVQAKAAQPKVNELVLLTTEYEQMVMKLEHTVHELVRNQEEKRAAEWSALQAQINPHFLYNTLNSIKCLVWTHKTEYIEPTINALVKLLHMTVQRNEDEITLREEYACLEHYVYIQEIRLSRKIVLKAVVEDHLWNCSLPKLLLQPIVENAIFHGIERKPEAEGEAIITLYAASDLDDVTIKIADNGVGMNLEQLDKPHDKKDRHAGNQFSGIGMNNVHERLQMNYGSRYGLSVHSVPAEGTTVTLTLPLRQAKQAR